MPPVHDGTIPLRTRTHQSNESGKLGVRDVAGRIPNYHMWNIPDRMDAIYCILLCIKFQLIISDMNLLMYGFI